LEHLQQVLFDGQGKRKYLTAKERDAFIGAAELASPEIRTFCMVLAQTGCRISEALDLTPDRIDFDAGVIIFETLKKRRKGLFRAVPVRFEVLDALDLVHQVRRSQSMEKHRNKPLWTWARNTGWRHVKTVMNKAGVVGPHASPKGLRHAFGILTTQDGVPINKVQKWLGHSRMETTAIYLDALGDEERAYMEKFWKNNR